MKWLYKLDYKYGRHYIRNLMTIIVGGMVAVYLLDMFMAPGGIFVSNYLTLNRAAVLSGQVWRLLTFIFVYPSNGMFWILISLYFYYMLGRMLENYWGGFKLMLYYIVGMLGAIAAMFITGGASNYYLNQTLFLALATLSPDTQFTLFFLIPIKAKWLAAAFAVLTVIPVVQAFLFAGPLYGLQSLVALAFSLVNYFLFFGPTLIKSLREEHRIRQNRRNWQNKWRN